MGVGRIVITVMSGADDGKVFELEKNPTTLGRHPEDDVCLPYDTRVSRHHARITSTPHTGGGNAYFIEDVGSEGKGSTNGTYLDDTRISGRTPVSSGVALLLGNVWVRFEVK